MYLSYSKLDSARNINEHMQKNKIRVGFSTNKASWDWGIDFEGVGYESTGLKYFGSN